jgi:hypothetical protein
MAVGPLAFVRHAVFTGTIAPPYVQLVHFQVQRELHHEHYKGSALPQSLPI